MKLVSYAQNFEDVMLWRALKHIENGCYIDVGAQDPIHDSVSKLFYEHGWRGIHIEPVPIYADLLRKDRPDEVVLQMAVSDIAGVIAFNVIPDTGLSTALDTYAKRHQAERGYVVEHIQVPVLTLAEATQFLIGKDIHWMKIDVEGFEEKVIKGWDSKILRPWIIVVESTIPNSQEESYLDWEHIVVDADYKFVYFDGLNRFYIAKEHIELSKAFSIPPNVFDDFVPHLVVEGERKLNILNTESSLTRTELDSTKAQLDSTQVELGSTKAQLDSTQVELGSTATKLNLALTESAAVVNNLIGIIHKEKEDFEKEIQNSNQNHVLEMSHKDRTIALLHTQKEEYANSIQVKDIEMKELGKHLNLLSHMIIERDAQLAIIQSSKFWKLRDIYIRGKWGILNPLKFLKKYVWNNIPIYTQIYWALTHPLKFTKKYVFKKKSDELYKTSNENSSINKRKILWVIPPLGLNGGLRTIFEIANVQSENNYVEVLSLMESSNPLQVDWMNTRFTLTAIPENQIKKIKKYVAQQNFDVVFATGCQTVQLVNMLGVQNKIYYVQDYEPNFHNVDTKIAERSYDLLQNKIVINNWVREKILQYNNTNSLIIRNGTHIYPDTVLEKAHTVNVFSYYKTEASAHRGSDILKKVIPILYSRGIVVKVIGHTGSPGEQCDFLGELRGEKLLDLYKTSSIFIDVSRHRGCPTIAMEAAQFGVVSVITNKDIGVSEYGFNENNAVFSSEDEYEIADKVTSLVNDFDRLHQMRQNAKLLSKSFDMRDVEKNIDSAIQLFEKKNKLGNIRVAVFVHLYYIDLWEDIRNQLVNIFFDFDLYVSIPSNLEKQKYIKIVSDIHHFSPRAQVLKVKNKGLDLGPFFDMLNLAFSLGKTYDFFLKIHTKKSIHVDPIVGENHRRHTYHNLLGTPLNLISILEKLEKPSVGMVGAKGTLMSISPEDKKNNRNNNEKYLNEYRKKLNIKDDQLLFFGGTMFWAKWAPFQKKFKRFKITSEEFEKGYAPDGLRAHAFERLFANLIRDEKLNVVENNLEENEGLIEIQPQEKHIQKVLDMEFNDVETINFKKYDKPNVSIIIPVYNKWQFTYNCLRALKKNTLGIKFEIIVVDNGSVDETKALFQKVKNVNYIRNDINIGFAKACNKGALYAKGEYIVFLNNDTLPLKGWLSALVKELDRNKNIGIVGSKLLYPNDTVQHAGILFNEKGPYHVNRGVQADDPSVNSQRIFPAVTGACLAIRKDLFEKECGFNEIYRNGYEDVDLCFRIRVLGYRVLYCPLSCLYHYESMTGGRENDEIMNATIFAHNWGKNDALLFDSSIEEYVGYTETDIFHLFFSKSKYMVSSFLNVYKTEGFISACVRAKNFLLYGKGYLKHIPQLTNINIKNSINSITASSALSIPVANHTEKIIVSIVIPVFNQIEYTLQCLKSIASHAPSVSFEVIVVDDASTDKTEETLSKRTDIKYFRNQINRGFGDSCNYGVSQSKGTYVFFLNNDTIVLDNWVDSAVKLLTSNPMIGLVGSQLIYPNGRLQEAGGIIFSDGSAGRYGWGDDPYTPLYNYVRDVDYCSAAAVMITKKLFTTIGGFDKRYSPAYYEDVDLAFAVRKFGHRVVYNPFSKIIHFEGMTAGKDITKGIKSYQVRNQKLFSQKWHVELSQYGKSGEKTMNFFAHRNAKKRILVIDQLTPTPNQDAGSLYMWNTLKILSNLGFQITFIPCANLAYIDEYTDSMQQAGIECMYVPYISSVSDFLKQRGSEYDYVMLVRIPTAEKYIDEVKLFCPQAKIIFNTIDVHYLRVMRQAIRERNNFLQAEAEKLKLAELSVMQKSDTTIVVSSVEKAILQKESKGASVQVVHLILDVNEYSKRIHVPQNHDILFIGGFNHAPNVDAVKWFCEDIFSLILQEIPDAHFHIVGSNVPNDIQNLASDRIIVHGYVADSATIIKNSRVTVAPLRFGAGQKGKILQSLALGVPCVATPLGAEGMNVSHGKELLVASSPRQFASAVVRLLKDDTLCDYLSNNGYELFKDQFSTEHATVCFEKLLDSLESGSQKKDDVSLQINKNSNHKPHIFFDCTAVYNKQDYYTGIQRVVRNIIKNVSQQYVQYESVFVVWEDNQFFRVRYSNTQNTSDSILLIEKNEVIELQPEDVFVVLDTLWWFDYLAYFKKLKESKVYVIGVIYDLIPLMYPQYCYPDFYPIFKDWIENLIVTSSGLIMISQDVKKEVENYSIQLLDQEVASSKWYDHFYLGNNLDLIMKDGIVREDIKKPFTQRKFVFLMVGTFEPRKNHQYLLNVFEELWRDGIDVTLCCIGRIGWKSENLLEEIKANSEFNNRLFIFHDATDVELEFCYTHATSLLFPAHAEGFGLPIVEALQRKLPVMASDIPVFREVGGDYIAYFDQNNPTSLVTLIKEFITSNRFPAAKSLTDWSWYDWKESTEMFLERIFKHIGNK